MATCILFEEVELVVPLVLTLGRYGPIIGRKKRPPDNRKKNFNSSSSDALNSCPDNQHGERKSDLTGVRPRIRTSSLKIRARASMGGTGDRILLDMLSGRPRTAESRLIFKIPLTIGGLLAPALEDSIFIKRLRGRRGGRLGRRSRKTNE
jgi:hypothetical protein